MTSTFDSIRGVFDDTDRTLWQYRYSCTLHLRTVAGGVPTDPKIAEGWIKTKLGIDHDELVRQLATQAMLERGEVDMAAIATDVNIARNLKGFKRPDGSPVIEGRQVKAMIRESANILWAKETWGPTRKGTKGWWAEHVHVVEEFIPLVGPGAVPADTEIQQGFVHTFRGDSVQYTEVAHDAEVTFTVISDTDLSDRWPALWVCAQMQGLGADRSKDHGRFRVIAWDKM